jgi:hypothetical protein
MRKLDRANSITVVLATLLLLVPLGLHAYIGLYSRYLADDYCTASTLRQLGFYGSQIDWYNNWSGRFSFTFFINATQLLGAGITPFLTVLIILIWLIVLRYTLSRVFRLIGREVPALWSLLMSIFILYAVLDSTPDIYQSLYWQTGMITYVVPLILFTLFFGWVSSISLDNLGQKPGPIILLGSGFLTFLAGGFSETFVAMQTTALAVIFLIMLFARRRDRKLNPALLVTGLAGSIIAMITVALAPGNSVRQALMPTPPDLLSLLGWSLRHGLAFAVKSALSTPITFTNSVILSAILAIIAPWNIETSTQTGKRNVRRLSTYLLGILIVTYLLIVASVAPSVYATSAYPAERALVTGQYVSTSASVIVGFLVGITLKPRIPFKLSSANLVRASGIILLGIGVLSSALRSTMIIPSARSFAQQWEQRNQELLLAFQQGLTETRASSLPHMGGLAEIGNDPSEWINRCVANSYGLERITSID